MTNGDKWSKMNRERITMTIKVIKNYAISTLSKGHNFHLHIINRGKHPKITHTHTKL